MISFLAFLQHSKSNLQEVGDALGFDTSNNATLWKDRVALEMNLAVLHSFKLANATIVDQVETLLQLTQQLWATEKIKLFGSYLCWHVLMRMII